MPGKRGPVFSNHWKTRLFSFQSLETFIGLFPTIGKFARDYYRDWKYFEHNLSEIPKH